MKKVRLVMLCFMILCAGNAVSQPGPPGLPSRGSKADSLMSEGDVPGAIVVYRKIYLQNPEDKTNVYNYACALSISKKADSSFKYLNIAVRMDTSFNCLMDPDFLTLRESAQWTDFENAVISMLNKKFNNPYRDIEYAKALWKFRALDQAYFNEIGIAGRKIGMRSSVVEALWGSKFRIQKQSQAELDALVAAKGWPRIRDVGREAAMGAYLVVMHSEDGCQKKYLEDIKKCCEAKELPWQRYANIYDRWLYNDKKPQKYGTHTIYNEETKTEELYPLQDPSKVDEWRKELGLEPLSEYLARMNIKYP